MRQKFFSVPFAVSGDQTPVADATDSSGIVTFTTGWGSKYSTEIADPTSLKLDRASTNYLFNVITDALGALQAVGVPEWIAAIDDDGTAFPYAKGAHVRYSSTPSTGPWVEYVSLIDANTDTPGATLNWVEACLYAATQAEVLAGTISNKIVTPLSLAGLFSGGGGLLGVVTYTLTSDLSVPLSDMNKLITVAGPSGHTITIPNTSDIVDGTQLIFTVGVVGAGCTLSGVFQTAQFATITDITMVENDTIELTFRHDSLMWVMSGGAILAPQTHLTGIDTTLTGTVIATDSIIGGVGKLQKQINVISQNISTKRLAPNFVNSGAMIAQRTIAPALSTSRQIGRVDNIGVWASGGAITTGGSISQGNNTGLNLGTTGYVCALTATRLSGSGQVSFSIRMEANDAAKYNGTTVSFSVKVEHTYSGPINFVLVANRPTTTADTFSARTVIATGSVVSVPQNTATLLTFNNVSIGSTVLGLELEVRAQVGAMTTTAAFYATEFYVNIEAAAGAYDAPQYNDEYLRCQRYLPGYICSAVDGNESLGTGIVTSIAGGEVWFNFAVPPRVPPQTGPQVISLGAFTLVQSTASGGVSSIATSIGYLTVGFRNIILSINGTGTPGYVQGAFCQLICSTAGATILFLGAEL